MSRGEMELHADKVAVSLTGSDALVEALARIRLADLAFDQLALGLQQASTEQGFARDLYRLHAQELERVALDHPELALPEGHERPDPARRLFARDDAPPRMWASHPPNREREESAKTPYLPAPRDDRPAWTLLANPEQSREALTALFNRLYLGMKEGTAPVDDPRPEPLGQGRDALYGADFVTTGTVDPEEWMRDLPARTDEELATALADRHGPPAREPFEARRRHAGELNLLLALATGRLPLEPSLKFRGQALQAGQVVSLAELVRKELVADVERIEQVHRQARVIARTAALRLGPDWVSAHRDALALLHLLEHEELRLRAVATLLGQVYHSAMALPAAQRGPVLSRRLAEQHRMLEASLRRLDGVVADPPFPGGLKGQILEEPLLPAPSQNNWDPAWLQRFTGQLHQAMRSLSKRTNVALGYLLDLEERIEEHWRTGQTEGAAPGPMTLPAHEARRMDPTASWRSLVLPRKATIAQPPSHATQAALSLLAAAVVLLVPSALWLYLSHTQLILYNGTQSALNIHVGASVYPVDAGQRVEVSRFLPWSVQLATERQGEILERAEIPPTLQVIYNAGRHGVFVDKEIVYSQRGDIEGALPELLGNPLVLPTLAHYVLDEPPERIESSGMKRRHYVFDASEGVPLAQMLPALSPEQGLALCESRLRHDRPSPEVSVAATILSLLDPERARTLTAELRERHPDELEAHRAYQIAREGDPAVLQEYRQRAEQTPSAMHWYLYGRLLEDPEQGRAAQLRALELDPALVRARIALARADARLGRWEAIGEDLQIDSIPPELSEEVGELRLRARRFAGERGLPDDLAAMMPTQAPFERASLVVEHDPSSLPFWLEKLPDFEAELRLAAGDLEGARRALLAQKAAHPETALRLVLSGPTSGWAEALGQVSALQSAEAALLAASAARAVRLPVEPFLAALDPELRALIPDLWKLDPADLPALDALARRLDLRRQWVVYAAAAVLAGDARPPAVVERAQRLSMPWELPRW